MTVYTGRDITSDRELECDVCIVGSGASGAVVAERLARAGKRVVVLEEGGFHKSVSFDMTERHMLPRLYQERAERVTADQSIRVAQGRALGGSTVVSYGSCLRVPEAVFDFWREHHGVEGITYAALAPHWERLEARLQVGGTRLAELNANNRALWDGAERLGLGPELLARSVRGCARTGSCTLGCPVDAQQSMLVTLLPDAVRAGADIYANAWVEHLVKKDRRCVAVVAKLREPGHDRPSGVTLRVRATITVLAGGAINTPALLLRSDVNANGRTGERTFLHPSVGVLGLHPRAIEAFAGVPQQVRCEVPSPDPRALGFTLEPAPALPAALGRFALGPGAEKQALLEQLPRLSVTAARLHDGFDLHDFDEGATVGLRRSGAPRLDYKWSQRLEEGLRAATATLFEVQLAAGAERALSGHPLSVERPEDIEAALADAPFGPNRLPVWSQHAMGGCAMGTNEKTTVVDSRTLRHHGFDDLFVIDGSVFPTGLTVPPQLTIHALAAWGSELVLQAVGG